MESPTAHPIEEVTATGVPSGTKFMNAFRGSSLLLMNASKSSSVSLNVKVLVKAMIGSDLTSANLVWNLV
jgi:hypothetical protein